MKDIILSVSGMPGLYKLVAQGNNNLIVENITDKKRKPIGARYSVSAINDISMYSEDGDVELTTILENLKNVHHAEPINLNHKKATEEELRAVMTEGLPNYNQDLVHLSDMRKLVQWYNILVKAGITEFKTAEKETAEETAEQE